MSRMAQILARVSTGVLLAFGSLLAVTGCSAISLPGLSSNANCPKAHDLNVAWGNLLIESGIGLTADDFTKLDSSPYALGGLGDVRVKELRDLIGDACVYSLQSDAVGYEGASGVFIYSAEAVDRSKVDTVLKLNGWRSETTVKSPDQDQSWSHNLCGKATEMTRIAQGKPELVGGFVEVFSKQLEYALPDTKFALAMTFPENCD